MEEVLRLGIDSTGAQTGAREFRRATASVQQGAQQADAATKRAEGGFTRLRDAAGLATRALGALGVTIGAGALVRSIARATAEMDTLRRGLEAIMGSAAGAAREMETLRRIAQAPGIDLKAAVQGATQLQAVGVGLGTTNRLLTEFANAVALSGGGGPELARVIVQLQQMAAAGKILTADLRPVIQTAPAVAKAMQEVFGTISAQELEDRGITTRQFFDQLLGGMEKLPRAASGAANSWDNFTSSVTQASAAFGSQFANSVQHALDTLSDALTSLSRNRGLLRELADGAKALGTALLVGGAVAGVIKLVAALRDLEVVTAGLTALQGPKGWLVLGVAALATYLYQSGDAARDAAKGVDDYRRSLGDLSKLKFEALKDQSAKVGGGAEALGAQARKQFRSVQRLFEQGAAREGAPGHSIYTTALAQYNTTLARYKDALKLQGEIQDEINARNSIGGITVTAPGRPKPETPAETAQRIATAVERAFDRLLNGNLRRIPGPNGGTVVGTLKNPDRLGHLAGNAEIVEARGGLGAAGLKGIPNFEPIHAGHMPDYSGLLNKGPLAAIKGAFSKLGGAIGGQVASIAAQFGPLALAAAALAPVFKGLRDVLGPVLSKLAKPLEIMGRILGQVVAPVLELLEEPLKAVATLFSVLIQPLRASIGVIVAYVSPGLKLLGNVLKVITGGLSYIVEGIGYVVRGLGQLVDKLVPDLISHAGKGLAKTGQEIIDGAKRARQGFDSVADAAQEASGAISRSLSTDLPKAINLALYRARIGSGGETGGGGSGGGPSGPPPRPIPGHGGGPVQRGHRPPAPENVNFVIQNYHSAANETPEEAAQKMARGAQILHSRGVTLRMPGLVTAS